VTSDKSLKRFHRIRLTLFAVLGLSFMLVYFHRVAPAVAAADLMRDFNIAAGALGSLAAMYFYCYALMQIPAGVLSDTLGVRVSAAAGALIAGAGSILFGLAHEFAVASIGRLMVGFGVSVVFVGFMRVNTVWWSERSYGIVSGIVVALGVSGAILAAGPLAALLQYTTWRAAFLGIGIASLVVGALTYLFVRDKPEDAGFPSLREMEGAVPYAPRTRHWWHDLRDVLRNRDVVLGFVANIGMTGAHMAFVGLWGVPLLMDVHGLSRTEASLYTSTELAAHGLGGFLFGTLSDRIGRRRPIVVVAGFVATLTWLGMLWLPWGPGISGFALYSLLGLCAGAFLVSYSIAKEVVNPGVAGMALAIVNAGVFFGAAVIQPLFGVLMDIGWDGSIVNGVRRYSAGDYANGLWLCLGVVAVSLFASLQLRETYARNLTQERDRPLTEKSGGG
jgi:sugar phosphate permease